MRCVWTRSVFALAPIVLLSGIAGCASPPTTTTVPTATVPVVTYPATSPTTIIVPPATPQRVTYPEGAYELYGTGTVASPYYWVWVPRGTTVSTLPPPPPLPPAR